jgi:hypothetical protein
VFSRDPRSQHPGRRAESQILDTYDRAVPIRSHPFGNQVTPHSGGSWPANGWSSKEQQTPDLDLNDPTDVLWGCAAIGREANIVDEDGEVDVRATLHKLKMKYLPGRKCGRMWISSRRAIRGKVSVTA